MTVNVKKLSAASITNNTHCADYGARDPVANITDEPSDLSKDAAENNPDPIQTISFISIEVMENSKNHIANKTPKK